MKKIWKSPLSKVIRQLILFSRYIPAGRNLKTCVFQGSMIICIFRWISSRIRDNKQIVQHNNDIKQLTWCFTTKHAFGRLPLWNSWIWRCFFANSAPTASVPCRSVYCDDVYSFSVASSDANEFSTGGRRKAGRKSRENGSAEQRTLIKRISVASLKGGNYCNLRAEVREQFRANNYAPRRDKPLSRGNASGRILHSNGTATDFFRRYSFLSNPTVM